MTILLTGNPITLLNVDDPDESRATVLERWASKFYLCSLNICKIRGWARIEPQLSCNAMLHSFRNQRSIEGNTLSAFPYWKRRSMRTILGPLVHSRVLNDGMNDIRGRISLLYSMIWLSRNKHSQLKMAKMWVHFKNRLLDGTLAKVLLDF